MVEKDEESEKRKFEKKQKEMKLAFEKVNKFVNNPVFICLFRLLKIGIRGREKTQEISTKNEKITRKKMKNWLV